MCKARKRIRAYIIICSKNHESSLPGSWGALIEGMVVWCCTLPIYAMRWNFLSDLKPISQKKRLARGGGKTANPVGPPFLFISWTRRLTIRRPIPRFWYSGSTATSQIVAINAPSDTARPMPTTFEEVIVPRSTFSCSASTTTNMKLCRRAFMIFLGSLETWSVFAHNSLSWTGSTSARFVLYTRGRGILIGHRGRGDWGKEVEAEIVPPPCLLEIERPGDKAFLESCRVIGGLWRRWKEGDGAWEEHRHENPTWEDAEEHLDTLRVGTKLSATILDSVCLWEAAVVNRELQLINCGCFGCAVDEMRKGN